MGRPYGSKTAAYVPATMVALKAEARSRFLQMSGERWSAMWSLRLGFSFERAMRRQERDERIRRAFNLLRTAARNADRVAAAEYKSLVSRNAPPNSESITDDLVRRLKRLVAELPRELLAPTPAWKQERLPSIRTRVAAQAVKYFGPVPPRVLAAIGVLVGAPVTARQRRGRLESVQAVFKREANAYARMKLRRTTQLK
jgi:hypothetical protein